MSTDILESIFVVFVMTPGVRNTDDALLNKIPTTIPDIRGSDILDKI
jgi:hypothetical protein